MTRAAPVYPVLLTNLAAARVVVVGGGQVAARKVAGLLDAGAAVTVISPALEPGLAAHHAAGWIGWEARAYYAGDLAGAWLAFAATDSRTVNAAVAREAAARGILCNVADAPSEGTFHVPAVARQEEFVIAVGSSGTAPRRAAQLRDALAGWLATHLSGRQTGDTDAASVSPQDPL
jgi:cobalt-precorrin 5A hydrolase/precorrin-3B C17-methyltransferase